MAIMVAGGMTIAIPGAMPQAAAQSMMLSVSADAAPNNTFGGPQIIEVVVDDPDRNEIDSPMPDVTVDDNSLRMFQANTGKWYGYFVADVHDAHMGDLKALPEYDLTRYNVTSFNNFPITSVSLDGTFEVEYGSESITLTYDEEAVAENVEVDRNNVPSGAQVHITITDFRLNLDPTAKNIWMLDAYGVSTGSASGEADDPISTSLEHFEYDAGEFTITDSDGITNIDTSVSSGDNDPETNPSSGSSSGSQNSIRFTETGANTGVFVSYNDGDNSDLVVSGSDGEGFDITYGDESVRVFIDDFDSAVELIVDG